MTAWWGVSLVVAYLTALVAIAEWAERGGVIARFGEHPVAFGLALGVYATSFTLFGGVGYADLHGYAILGFYLGVVLSCLAIPVLWWPLARIIREQRLSSLPDLLAFRFAAPVVGPVVTGVLLVGLLPYLSLQLRALERAATLVHGPDVPFIGPVYAALLGLFAVVVGTRITEPGAHRPGLLTTLAVESVVKLVATATVGAAALWGAFGGPDGLAAHFAASPEAARALLRPLHDSSFVTLVGLSFLGAFLLPRQFHVAFALHAPREAWRHAIWVLPLLLLGLLLPVPVLLEAGRAASPGTDPDLFVMTWTDDPGLQLVAFLGAVSASSAMVLVTSVALSGMVVTHLVLPLRPRQALSRRWLRRIRQAVTVSLVGLGLVADAGMSRLVPLVDLGLMSFAIVAQFAPGVLAVLVWRRATSTGLLIGLFIGLGGVVGLIGWPLQQGVAPGDVTDGLLECIVVNGFGLVVGSLLTQSRPHERRASTVVGRGGVMLPPDVVALRERVARQVGPELAQSEFDGVVRRLGIDPRERRPDRLRALMRGVEQQLSGLVGPLLARASVYGNEEQGDALVTVQLFALEERGEPDAQLRDWLGGLLSDLPDGVAVADRAGEVRLWSPMASAITGFSADAVVGARLDQLPFPLPELLQSSGERPVALPVGPRVLVVRARELSDGTRIVLITDRTDQRRLEAEVDHRARLASVGRMAAGVAHEIRNPLLGMLLVAGNLRRDLADQGDADACARLDALLGEGHRIEGIVRTLLDHSRSTDDAPRPLAVRDLVDQVRTLAAMVPGLREHPLTVHVDEIRVHGTASSLVQVLVNLLANAAQASPEGRPIEVRAAAVAGEVRIDVLDEGPGVDESVMHTLFEPFVTTKPVGEGTGLGLAVCWRIVQAHGGVLTHERVKGRTCFSITLPAVEAG